MSRRSTIPKAPSPSPPAQLILFLARHLAPENDRGWIEDMASELPYIRGVLSQTSWLLSVLGFAARLRLAGPGRRSAALLALSVMSLTLAIALGILLLRWPAAPSPAALADNPGAVQRLELPPAPDTDSLPNSDQQPGTTPEDERRQASSPPKADASAADLEAIHPAESPSPRLAVPTPSARGVPSAEATESTEARPADTALSTTLRRLEVDHVTVVAHRGVQLEAYRGILPHQQELLLDRYLEPGESVELALPVYLRVDDGGAAFLLAAGQDLGPLGGEGIPLAIALLPRTSPSP